MTGFKSTIKYAVLAALLIALVIGMGANIIEGTVSLELKRSTYTRTDFDFHIAAPDKAQVADIEADASVECVFPYYAYSKAFSSFSKVMLLVSDDMDDYGASLLTEGTLIEGSYDRSGAMLDKTAADSLGVGVGDSISFTLLGRRYTKTVSAIYLPSTFAILEDGIVLTELANDVTAPAAYSGAFIVAKDKSAVSALLSGYVGEGNVALSYEQYVELKCGNIKPGQSVEDYNAECESKYAAYRAEVLASASRDGGQVVDKNEAFSLLRERILTTEKSLSDKRLFTSVGAFALMLIVSIIFTVTNTANDRIRRDTGLRSGRMWLGYFLCTLISALVAASVSAGVLFYMASGTYFAEECMSMIYAPCIAIVSAAVLSGIGSLIHVRLLYNSSASH